MNYVRKQKSTSAGALQKDTKCDTFGKQIEGLRKGKKNENYSRY